MDFDDMGFLFCILPVVSLHAIMDQIPCDEEIPAHNVAIVLGLCIDESRRRFEAIKKTGDATPDRGKNAA